MGGSKSVGGVVWGVIASVVGIGDAMFIGGCTLAIGTFLSRKCELNQGEVLDLSPSTLWPEPIVIVDSECEKEMLHERSPVMVTVEYHIDKADVENFLSLMYQLGRMRRQYGAYTWNILQESDQPGIYIEQFMDISWLHHLRHRKRLTREDVALLTQVNKLHQGDEAPKKRNFLGS